MSAFTRPLGLPLSTRSRLLLLLCLAVFAGPCGAQSAGLQNLDTFPRGTLEIVHRDSAHRTHTYHVDVWVADTPERAEQGLMFVSDLPETRGMVFPLSPPRVENMWMKNTYVELDMLFVDADGRIAKIIERARPLSLQTLSSDKPVSAVVELRGGEATKLSLALGDQVALKAASR